MITRILQTIDVSCGDRSGGKTRSIMGEHSTSTGSFRRGFTLTEILVVALLIGLLASSSGTIAYGTYKRVLVEKAAKGIYLSAKYARLLAVEKQQVVTLALDQENSAYMLTVGSLTDADGKQSMGKVVSDAYAKPTKFGGNVVYEQITVAPSYRGESEYDPKQSAIVFYPDGTADTAAVQMGDGTSHYTVYVLAATGKAQVRFGEAEDAPIDIIDLDAEGL